MAEIEHQGGADPEQHAEQDGRCPRGEPLAADDDDERRSPDGERGGQRAPVEHPADDGDGLGDDASASTEKPSSFGSWPTRIVSASPFM